MNESDGRILQTIVDFLGELASDVPPGHEEMQGRARDLYRLSKPLVTPVVTREVFQEMVQGTKR